MEDAELLWPELRGASFANHGFDVITEYLWVREPWLPARLLSLGRRAGELPTYVGVITTRPAARDLMALVLFRGLRNDVSWRMSSRAAMPPGPYLGQVPTR